MITGANHADPVGEIALSLDQIGVRVALVGHDLEKLEETRAALSGPGRDRALVAPCDVADRTAVTAMVEHVLATMVAIDILVCNAQDDVRHQVLKPLGPPMGQDE